MLLADGQVIAGYTIQRSLGAGGMGEVYLARHPRLPRSDALKVLPATVSTDDEYRQRFNREADIAATLWHPHIVAVHDRGEYQGQLWISMDYVEGTDAGRLLAEHYPSGMPPEVVVRIVTAVADALDYAHDRGLLHRDVKPANLLIANPGTDHERIMLADFGVARWVDDSSGLTGTNMTVGTVSYAAPEQLTGDEVGGRADQYALAATAFQLLTGAPPFQHSNPAVVISQHLTAAPPPIGSRRPELSGLGPVFDKALAKSPDDRYDRCIDFARALVHRMGAADHDVSAADATMPAAAASVPRRARHRQRSPSRRLHGLPVVPIAAAVGLIAVAAVGFVLFDRTRHHSAEAEPKPSPPETVSLPVVFVGANCATLGAAGITEDGAPAYCAHLPSVDKAIWSLYPGKVASPTMTARPGDRVFSSETEAPVLVCIEQTGQSRLDCHEDIVEGNEDAAAAE